MTSTGKIGASVKNLSESTINSSRIGKTTFTNPLINWSADIVEVLESTQTGVSNELRVRDLDSMHNHNRREDTVASIKIIKESSDINNIQDRFRDSFSLKTDIALTRTDVLFETTNFILQSSSEQDAEKFQILDNFGDPQIFMFGRRPRIYSYTGMLWNEVDNNWKDEFRYIYNNYLRGTKCVQNGVKIMLTYDRSVRMGYILNVGMNQNAETVMAIPFNFSMFIESEKDLISQELIDPAATNQTEMAEDVFRLIRRQGEVVTKERQGNQQAIERKLILNKISEQSEKKTNVDDGNKSVETTQVQQTDIKKIYGASSDSSVKVYEKDSNGLNQVTITDKNGNIIEDTRKYKNPVNYTVDAKSEVETKGNVFNFDEYQKKQEVSEKEQKREQMRFALRTREE